MSSFVTFKSFKLVGALWMVVVVMLFIFARLLPFILTVTSFVGLKFLGC